MIYDIEDLSLLEGLDPVIMSKEELEFAIDDADLVFEAFAGKMPYADKIEKLMKSLVDKINDAEDILLRNKNKSYNSLPETKELEVLFKKAFGFKDFVLNLYDVGSAIIDSPAPNAFARPVLIHHYLSVANIKKLVLSGKLATDAVYSTMFVNVSVDVNLIRLAKLTPRETIAIILHEIGHNAEISYTNFVSNVSLIATLYSDPAAVGDIAKTIATTLGVGVMSYGPTNQIITKVEKTVNDVIMNIPYLNKLTRFGVRLYREFKAVKQLEFFIKARDLFQWFLTFTIMDFQKLANFKGETVKWYTRYSSEKFADSFAAKWGYGPDMASSVFKINNTKELTINKILKKIPIFDIIYFDIFKGVVNLVDGLLEYHPHAITRARTQFDNLKKDLNDPDLDPRLKKELAENLKEYEEVMNRMTKFGNNEVDGKYFQTLMNKIFNSFFGVSDIRDIIAPNIRA